MTGLKTTSMTSAELLKTSLMGKSKTQKIRIQTATPSVWDDEDEDDRPQTREEMQADIEAYRRERGRLKCSDKESTTIRFDREVLATFRAGDPGWQTRMNAVLRD